MEIFRLFGSIFINTDAASQSISETTEKAKSFSEKLAGGFKSVGESAVKVGSKMSLGLTTPLTLIGKKAVDVAADFEYSMSEVGAISGANGEDLAALRTKAEEMGKTTKFSASESAEALKYMAMAGWKTGDMLDGLEGIMNLAAASGEDLGTTSDIVTDALTAFGLTASDSGHFADILATASSNANTNVGMMGETFKYVAPVAGALGYSAEDTAVAIGLMANAGIKSSQAGTSLRSILSNLQGEVKFAGAQFGEMAIQTTNADGSMRGLGDILGDCRVAFSMMSESERASNAEMVVGREAMSGFLAVMNAAPSDIDKLNDAIGKCDGAAKSMADTMNDNLSGQMTLLKSQLEGLAIQFVTLVIPYLKQGVEWLSKVCDWIAGLDDGTKKMIMTIGAVLAAAGPVLIFFGKVVSGIGSIIQIGGTLIGGIGRVSGAVTSVISIGGKLAGGIVGLVGKIGGVLIPAIGSISGPVLAVIAVLGALVAAGVAVYKNWDEIQEWGQRAWASAKEAVGNAVDGIVGFFGSLGEKAGEMKDAVVSRVTELKDGAVEKFTQLKDSAIEKATELKDRVVDRYHELKEGASAKITELKERAVERFGELKERASAKVSELKDKAVSEITSLKEKASSQFQELKDRAVEKVNTLKENAVSRFQELRDRASEKIQSLKEKSVAGFEELRAKGLEKFDRLKSGVTEKLEAVKNFVSNTVQKLKGFFNFDWSLPKIKLPHFSMEGRFSLDPPSIPHIGVEWYKKAMDSPVVMEKPTAFGINPAGQIMAGGEAGSEVVSGTETLMEMISAAVAEENSQLRGVLERIYSLLAQYFPALAKLQVVLDTGALVGEMAGQMDEELGQIAHMRGRWN